MYATIDDGIKAQILIQHKVWQLPIEGPFYGSQVDHNDLMKWWTLKGVYGGDFFTNDITAAFLAADIEPKCFPEFARTLLSRQKKLFQ